MVQDKKYEGARANLLAARLRLEAYRAMVGAAQAADVSDLEKEIEKLCEAVLKALTKGPMDPDGIRAATGNASRSLGEEGKKKGLSTTFRSRSANSRPAVKSGACLSTADSISSGISTRSGSPIRCRASRGRSWMPTGRWRAGSFAGCPATLGEFQWFSALGVRVSKDVVEPLALVPAEPSSGEAH